jgi:hypothetical protein
MLFQTSFSDSNGVICYCAVESTCTSLLSGFFNLYAYERLGDYTSSVSLISNVTGFVAGCYEIESILSL